MRVVVAMSGGVDSSTAAYLLSKQGYEVIGVSLKLFDSSSCCGVEGINDARAVAFKLKIPFYALNYTEEFDKEVVDYFTKEYTKGRTPNPCIACNEKIKFTSLLKKAKALGAEYIATGHYARIKYDENCKRYILKKAKDKTIDQSYFLFSLSQQALKHSLFPLAEFSKDQVRKIAKDIGIKVYNKPKSQEICFIPDDDYKSFLSNRDPEVAKPGPIVDTNGRILGEHKGIAFYTVGQRKGLRIPYGKPIYILAIDKEKNTITVGEEKQTYSKRLIATNQNWIATDDIKKPLKIKAKIRYNHKPADAVVSKVDDNKIMVEFDKPQRSVTPGQAAVFYKKDTVLGGAIIDKAIT